MSTTSNLTPSTLSEVSNLSGIQYARQLAKRWGIRAPQQFLRMWRLHRIPFDSLLSNIFEALDSAGARFAFPTVAAVASMRPELVRWIEREGHEVASHGYVHVRYPQISARARREDLTRSIAVLGKLGVNVQGFRAPYDNYADDMPLMLEELGLAWDGGLGYRPEHRGRHMFFHVDVGGRQSRVTYIPLNVWSDDRMIDTLGMTPAQITKRLKIEAKRAAEHGGVVMFDLHPIRIGQNKYVGCLRELAEYAVEIGGWCPTPAEAVCYWNDKNRWPGDSRFCMLLTGDIDNWVFSDYLRRQIWKRYLWRGV
ncbi:MAG: hypothetical protein DRO93_04925 [Candidatus Thorarchaeota archaeon]|nr:MAG: hypothetical protein DRO93_04925 [Candidatus Thorarchaeota archaeon]